MTAARVGAALRQNTNFRLLSERGASMTALLLHNVKLIILLVFVGLIVGLSQSAGERDRLATKRASQRSGRQTRLSE
jgi:hypothetical protein